MDFIPKHINSYAERHSTPESSLLADLNRETHLKVIMPRMLSGHIQGSYLSMISHMMRPKRVLEIGTYTAYSTICLAEGLADDGQVFSVDINEELEPIQRRYIERAGMEDQIKLHHGDALEWIKTLKETWDLVFIDADKENYCNYYDEVFPHVRTGGWIVADNVLWSGKVAENPIPDDHETQALDQFNRKVQNDDRTENLLVPFRDGLMMVRKL